MRPTRAVELHMSVIETRRTRWSTVSMLFHWVTAVWVAGMLVVGFWMTYRGNTLNLWDDTTNTLYSTHKLAGFLLLWFVLARVAWRIGSPTPAPDASLPRWQQAVAAANHVTLYALLIAMPLLGWTAVSLYPALDTLGGIALPALTAPDPSADKAMYNTVAARHGIGAFVLIGLVALHIAAALFHLLVRRDGVFQRMWPQSR